MILYYTSRKFSIRQRKKIKNFSKNFRKGIDKPETGCYTIYRTYGNESFQAAEKHGLTVEKDAKYGWTKTSLNDEAKAFVDGMQDKKFELHRKSLPKIPGAAKTKQSSRKYVCPMCGCIIRATKEVHVICGDCNVEFEEEA